MNRNYSAQDIQKISEYLDGTLSQKDRIQFEGHLRLQPELQDELEALRRTRLMLRQMPKRRAPRNFFVTPQMLPKRQAQALFPVFRLATALAGILLVFVFAGDLLFGAVPQNSAPLVAPLTSESQFSAVNRQANANSPIIVWGSPTPGAFGLGGAPLGIGGGRGGGGGGDATEGASIASQPQTTAPSEPTSIAPNLVAPPQTTPGIAGGGIAPDALPTESSTTNKTAPLATAPATSLDQSSNTAQTTSESGDQFQSGPILGVNPTEGAADASALKNPPSQISELTHSDFHVIEGSLALIAILAGLAAIYFYRRESL